MSNERHLRQLNPTKDKSYIDSKVEGSPTDNTGSQPDRRFGTLRGCPSVTRITFDNTKRIDDHILKIGQTKNIYVEGYNMYYMSNLYLSGSDLQMFETPAQQFSYFADNFDNRITSENPPFTGIPVSSWTVINDNNIYFEISNPIQPGTLDIILQGPAGYSRASQQTKYIITIVD